MSAQQMAKYYLDILINGGEDKIEDAIHSLIEMQSECLPTIEAALNTEVSSKCQVMLIEVLRDINQAQAQQLLLRAVESEDPKVWKEAIDAVAYQSHGDVVSVLEEIKRSSLGRDTELKCQYMDSVIHDLK